MIEGSAKEIWEAALGELQIQVSKPNYRTWLEKTTGLSYQESRFMVSVPNSFVAEYLDQKLRSLIEKTLINLTQNDIEVLFQVENGHKNLVTNSPVSDRLSVTTAQSQLGLNSKYTFDSFIVGSCNRLAHAAALGIVENPGHVYNPLFLCGGAGLGKTHLLQAIGFTALASNMSIIYVNAEQFTNEFVNAIREKRIKEFRTRYLNAQMLLVDDIHFISHKEQTEETFFHTFNALHNSNRQIVITSNCTPSALSLMHEGLRSRFEWGLIADLQPPDYETRLAILKVKANQQGANVPPDILEFIAHRTQPSIRSLEGSLNRVIAFAKLTREPLTTELADRALKDITGNKKDTSITPNLIVRIVANSFQLTATDLIGRKRDKSISRAREIAIYLLRQETGCTLAQIGKDLGGRQPISISQSYQKAALELETNPQLKAKVSDIQQSLYTG
ncbi:chromosomal replication initiator protein DnaA [Chloroflexota bacterium]